jgi:hypothetical protein
MFIDFYGLVAVAPAGNNALTWQRTDGSTYTIQLVSINNYYGAGASPVPGFSLTISVSFTSPTTLAVAYTLISDADTNCKYTYQYNGVKAW